MTEYTINNTAFKTLRIKALRISGDGVIYRIAYTGDILLPYQIAYPADWRIL